MRSCAHIRTSNIRPWIAILDLASREITELESTRTTNVSIDEQCGLSTRCEGQNDTPRWSPDGTRLVFARQVMSPEPGSSWTSAAIYVVNVDGSNLRRLTPEGWYAFDPSWNADGSALVFVNAEMIVNDDRTSVTGQRTDVYTVSADGADMRRLTNDGASSQASMDCGRQSDVSPRDRPGRRRRLPELDHGLRRVRQEAAGDQPRRAAVVTPACLKCAYSVDQSTSVALWQPIAMRMRRRDAPAVLLIAIATLAACTGQNSTPSSGASSTDGSALPTASPTSNPLASPSLDGKYVVRRLWPVAGDGVLGQR